MSITWISKYHGREGELARLKAMRDDHTKQPFIRLGADKGYQHIVRQLKDKKLMGLRDRLIKAAQAGDAHEQDKIMQHMRAIMKEDRETGL